MYNKRLVIELPEPTGASGMSDTDKLALEDHLYEELANELKHKLKAHLSGDYGNGTITIEDMTTPYIKKV